MAEFRIGNRKVGTAFPPMIVAEMSGNHNQSLKRALEIVEAAARAGAHALKIQTYTAETMTIDHDKGEFFISDPASLWQGKSLYRLYQEAYTPWEWHQAIFDRCRELGLLGFSTPFDESAVEFLESLGVPCYKIASFENIDTPLIRRCARTGKPLIISTGMATVAELSDAVEAARSAGCKDLILLKCTSTYPAEADNSHVRTIPHMRQLFECEIGLSDHTMGVGAAVAAVALGAVLVEKHFTLRRADGGVDSKFSLEPEELRLLVTESEIAWRALGNVHYGPTDAERISIQYRRSLYIVRDLTPGDVLTTNNVRAIRPGLGLAPKWLDTVLGRKVRKAVPRGTPVTWELFNE
jgi:pseudaminic acid synthase